jgi:hypothetical protein
MIRVLRIDALVAQEFIPDRFISIQVDFKATIPFQKI